MYGRRVLLILGAMLIASGVSAQSTTLRFKQETDGASPVPLSAAEKAELGDPLFDLLLRDKADARTLDEIIGVLQPAGGAVSRSTFVVHERIVDSRTAQASRRVVVAFKGRLGDHDLAGNVMLSVSVDANGRVVSPVEAWGWDGRRGRYNYYKVEGPAGDVTWRFRGSSLDADNPNRVGTCMLCHVSGAPIMKELLFPWNNWHSFKAPVPYLDPNAVGAGKWPAASTALFRNLDGADRLEVDFMLPSLRRFNKARLDAAILRAPGTATPVVTEGRHTFVSAQKLLKPLFMATEVNLISSPDQSGFHPFGAATDFSAAARIRLPVSFFLNHELIARRLDVDPARRFTSFEITQAENRQLIEQRGLRLAGAAGDTNFAWFVPERAFVDDDMVAQLLAVGALSPHFVAAVLAIDLEEPVFSNARAGLLRFVPDRFEFVPLAEGANPLDSPTDARLTREVVARIDADNPQPGSPAHEFRALLNSPNAVQELARRVSAYLERTQNGFANDRAQTIASLFGIMVERRRALAAHPILKALDETGGTLLFPRP